MKDLYLELEVCATVTNSLEQQVIFIHFFVCLATIIGFRMSSSYRIWTENTFRLLSIIIINRIFIYWISKTTSTFISFIVFSIFWNTLFSQLHNRSNESFLNKENCLKGLSLEELDNSIIKFHKRRMIIKQKNQLLIFMIKKILLL